MTSLFFGSHICVLNEKAIVTIKPIIFCRPSGKLLLLYNEMTIFKLNIVEPTIILLLLLLYGVMYYMRDFIEKLKILKVFHLNKTRKIYTLFI